MANFIVEDIKRIFRGDNSLSKVLLINVLVFITLNLVLIFGNGTVDEWAYEALVLPSNWYEALTHVWTLLTYQFTHQGLMHLISNMLWLYWIGRIFMEFQGGKRFLTVYLLGGLAGGLLYIIMGLIPGVYSSSGYLLGASGAVLAIVVATATLLPDYTIRLLLIGPVRLKYIAVGAIVLTVLVDSGVNTGGMIAHFGGAIFGYIYIKQLRQGNNLGTSFEKLGEWIKGLFTRKPKMNVYKAQNATGSRKRNGNTTSEGGMSTTEKQARVDAILDKIHKSGYESLSKEEKDFLFRMSKN